MDKMTSTSIANHLLDADCGVDVCINERFNCTLGSGKWSSWKQDANCLMSSETEKSVEVTLHDGSVRKAVLSVRKNDDLCESGKYMSTLFVLNGSGQSIEFGVNITDVKNYAV